MRDAWPLVALAIVVVGLATLNAAVVAAGALALIVYLVARLWSRLSLERVQYDRRLDEDHAFPGDSLTVELRIANRKPLPLPWVAVDDTIPLALASAGDEDVHDTGQPGRGRLEWRTSAWAHQRVARDVEIQCRERGAYELGPASVASGDPFGLFERRRDDGQRARVIVYPRTLDLPPPSVPARRPYGDVRGGSRLFEDPARVAGLRDYEPGDELRRIDWKATARCGALQSRVYEPASSHNLIVCLNAQTVIPAWAGFVSDVLERSVSVAASVARDAHEQRYSIGLLSNVSFPNADRPVRIAPAARAEQLMRVLEALAITTSFIVEPLSASIDREEHRLLSGATVVVVTGVMPDDLAESLARLARRRVPLAVLNTSGERWDNFAGDVIDVSAAGDARWRDPSRTEAPA